jgi:hypothetical protein
VLVPSKLVKEYFVDPPPGDPPAFIALDRLRQLGIRAAFRDFAHPCSEELYVDGLTLHDCEFTAALQQLTGDSIPDPIALVDLRFLSRNSISRVGISAPDWYIVACGLLSRSNALQDQTPPVPPEKPPPTPPPARSRKTSKHKDKRGFDMEDAFANTFGDVASALALAKELGGIKHRTFIRESTAKAYDSVLHPCRSSSSLVSNRSLQVVRSLQAFLAKLLHDGDLEAAGRYFVEDGEHPPVGALKCFLLLRVQQAKSLCFADEGVSGMNLKSARRLKAQICTAVRTPGPLVLDLFLLTPTQDLSQDRQQVRAGAFGAAQKREADPFVLRVQQTHEREHHAVSQRACAEVWHGCNSDERQAPHPRVGLSCDSAVDHGSSPSELC